MENIIVENVITIESSLGGTHYTMQCSICNYQVISMVKLENGNYGCKTCFEIKQRKLSND